MTSLSSPLRSSRTDAPRPGDRAPRSTEEVRRDLATRRPLVATATLGGAFAAAGPLVVCLALAVVGWFLTDAAGHGQPSDALRVGAFGWLLAHGAGVTIDGAHLTAIPLGVTLVCAWTVWRVGQRVGEAVSGHGPDADRIADGERDWTAPLTIGLFSLGYLLVATGTVTLAATLTTDPSLPRVLGFSALLTLAVGGPAIAKGSGRAAIWLATVPAALREAVTAARSILLVWAGLAFVALLVALVLDFATAANVVSQLDASAADTAMIAVLTLVLLPNAVLFSSAYLLGPGFTVGTGTLVSPTLVVLGPLPMFPLLAALPDNGPTPAWTPWLLATPVLVAAVVAGRSVLRAPASGFDTAAVRGCGGGLIAGVLLGLVTLLAGGTVGPGRMRDVGPAAGDVFLHAVTAFGIGGLLGALLITAWQRRGDRFARLGRLAGRLRPGRTRL